MSRLAIMIAAVIVAMPAMGADPSAYQQIRAPRERPPDALPGWIIRDTHQCRWLARVFQSELMPQSDALGYMKREGCF